MPENQSQSQPKNNPQTPKTTDRQQLSKAAIYGAPVNLEEHQKDQACRQARRDKNRHKLRQCLNPEVAAQYEALKPRYRWKVTATFMKENSKTGVREETTETRTVLAQDENDAWAKFGDQLGFGLAPKSCEREIEQLERVNAA